MSPQVAQVSLVVYHGLLALLGSLLALGGALTGEAALALRTGAVAVASAVVAWGLLRLTRWSWWGAVAADVYGLLSLVIWPSEGWPAVSLLIALVVAVLLWRARPLFQDPGAPGSVVGPEHA